MRARSRALRPLRAALFGTLAAATATLAAAQCPDWDPGFGGSPGLGVVQALKVFDDGTGSALYVGGEFIQFGGIPAANVVRRNGTNWSAVGAITTMAVRAFATHDDGSGPALYAGGGSSADSGGQVWRWDGAVWTQVGPTSTDSSVYALASFDDGTGARLYAASWGQIYFPFSTYLRIKRFDGVGWTQVLSSDGAATTVCLAVHDDGLGAGPGLYVGGFFTNMTSPGGSIAASSLVRWDGTSLTPF